MKIFSKDSLIEAEDRLKILGDQCREKLHGHGFSDDRIILKVCYCSVSCAIVLFMTLFGSHF